LFTKGQTVFLAGFLPHGNDLSHKLMPGDHRRLAVAFSKSIPPEERGSDVTFDVAGTYPHT
jgi:hypothetical protein